MKLTTKLNVVLAATFLPAILVGGTCFYLFVIGAQPLPVAAAREAFIGFIVVLALVCVALFIVINIAIRKLVLVPVSRVTRMADEVTNGNLRDAEIKVAGSDELAQMTAGFNQMRRSLIKMVQLLRKHQAEAMPGKWKSRYPDLNLNPDAESNSAAATAEAAK